MTTILKQRNNMNVLYVLYNYLSDMALKLVINLFFEN